MALLTEKGTGQGSRMANVTVRAWVVMGIVAVICLNATAITFIALYAFLMGKIIPAVTVDPTLANIACVVIGWYFRDPNGGSKETSPQTQPKA